MKIIKYSLLSILFICSTSFATQARQEQVILPSLIEVIVFCSSDKSCNSITPVLKENDVNYKVKYEVQTLMSEPPVDTPTDPTDGDDD